jgi:hypothetical protein
VAPEVASGGPGRARTDDLPGVSGLRYQLRHGPAGKGTHEADNHQSAVRPRPIDTPSEKGTTLPVRARVLPFAEGLL